MRKVAAERGNEEQARRVADAVYGTILVIAVVAALSKDDAATPGAILAGALATSLVFWIVHVYAEMLSRRTAGDRRPTWPVLRGAAVQEWPLVEAALAPLVPLLLGAFGIFERSTSITLSIVIGLIDLAGWGFLAGRQMGESRVRAVLTAAGAVSLGVVMVLLKNLVH
jgi:outer membrane lipoprotein SlyB